MLTCFDFHGSNNSIIQIVAYHFAGFDNADVIGHSARIQAASMRGHGRWLRALLTRDRGAGRILLLCALPHVARRGLHEAVHRGVWRRPVRRGGHTRVRDEEVVLQLVGVRDQHRGVNLGHRARVCAGLRELGVGLRHAHRAHGRLLDPVRGGHEVLPPQAPHGEPVHANRAGQCPPVGEIFGHIRSEY